MSPNMIGAFLMMASMACFTLNDTLIKLSGAQVPLFQLIFLRSMITCALILVTRGYLGALHLRIARRDWTLIAVRAGTEVIIAYFFINALLHMPLANVTAILQVVPLAVTLASALVLREAVGWRRFLAIGIGFIGVLMIVKPGAAGFNSWSMYALVAVLAVTVRDLATRRLSPTVPSMTVTLMTALAVMGAAGVAALTEPWVAIAPQTGGMIALAALCVLGGYHFSVQVMRTGDVAFTAPFRYTGLIWAFLLGWFVFGEWPDLVTLLGAAIIAATGLFTFYREQQLSPR